MVVVVENTLLILSGIFERIPNLLTFFLAGGQGDNVLLDAEGIFLCLFIISIYLSVHTWSLPRFARS